MDISKKQIISIEGNIGAGKSTFVNIISNYVKNSEIVSEPVEMWKSLSDSDGKNILDKYYQNIPRWAYSFQNLACITRMMKIEDTIRNSNKEFLFLDRSLGTDKNVFEKMLHDSKQITELEHQMYNLWCDFYHKYVRPEFENIVIYLRCSPETALQRIKKRGRIEEQNITLDYLKELHKYHENWLVNIELLNENNNLIDSNQINGLNVIIVNCEKDFENDHQYQNQLINKVVSEINSIIKNQLKNTDAVCSIKKKIVIDNSTEKTYLNNNNSENISSKNNSSENISYENDSYENDSYENDSWEKDSSDKDSSDKDSSDKNVLTNKNLYQRI
jgi:deoxycitidine kinase